MNRKEYVAYEAAVAEFFDGEGIENLTGGNITCPECKAEWDDADKCPNGHGHRDLWNEPFFSKRSCECCGALAGNRYHATGYNRERNEIHEYTVCQDCIFYAEYGWLGC